VEDPAAVTGSVAEVAAAFAAAERRLRRRIEHFLALPPEVLDGPDVRARLEAIGKDTAP
jgi:arsenate reductase